MCLCRCYALSQTGFHSKQQTSGLTRTQGTLSLAERTRLGGRVYLTSVTGAKAPGLSTAQSPGEAILHAMGASRTEFKSRFHPFTGYVTLSQFVKLLKVQVYLSEEGE